MASPRFALEWVLPQEVGLMTHVTLFDEEHAPHPIVASGHGADEAETLLDLWTTLTDQHEPEETIAFVAAAYRRRTGHEPVRPTIEAGDD